MKNSRSNYFQELAGLRMVKMYVEEYFHWGFQQIDQENDDGLDGIIIVRNHDGRDSGVCIHCQIKCGPSYLKRETDESLFVQPYTPKSKLLAKFEHYARLTEPAILVYVNTAVDKRNPPCWWLRLDKYKHDGTSQITIPKKLKFGEHSKGDLVRIVRPYMKNWNNFQLLQLDSEDRKLFYSTDLRNDATKYYNVLRPQENIQIKSNGRFVSFTRIGWRHINKYKRGRERISTSLRLLSVAKRIIVEYESPLILLKERVTDTIQCRELYYGLRARLKIGLLEYKVQVVLRNWINPAKGIDKLWFYSVHTIK